METVPLWLVMVGTGIGVVAGWFLKHWRPNGTRQDATIRGLEDNARTSVAVGDVKSHVTAARDTILTALLHVQRTLDQLEKRGRR